MIKVGDLVIRKSHGGDIVFKVTDITQDMAGTINCTLKGLHLRLVADAPIDDLERVSAEHLRNEILQSEKLHNERLNRVMNRRSLEREHVKMMRGDSSKKYSFFDIPGKILHLDGDEEYLRMCIKTYGQLRMQAVGLNIDEEKQPERVYDLLKEHHPDILILTGHDALVGGGKKDLKDINNYRTSKHFVQAVRNARLFNPSRDDLVIFAGACQSYFEAILEAGANFASSPIRIFIHAYDPVFIAEKVAFTTVNKIVDISDAITSSVTGIEGVGGIETRGKFRLGLPKTPYA